MFDFNSFFGCLGHYGDPIASNGPCNSCPVEALCRRVVAKERLNPIIKKIETAIASLE